MKQNAQIDLLRGVWLFERCRRTRGTRDGVISGRDR
jgi:hypothetical protein